MSKLRPLGYKQQAVLRALWKHGQWYEGCGWVWDNHCGTKRILNSLVRQGLASTTSPGPPDSHWLVKYRITQEGRSACNGPINLKEEYDKKHNSVDS